MPFLSFKTFSCISSEIKKKTPLSFGMDVTILNIFLIFLVGFTYKSRSVMEAVTHQEEIAT